MDYNLEKVGETIAKEAKPLQISRLQLPDSLVRKTWLHYFNNYLRERHIITEDEWRKMRRLIDKD